MTVNHEVQRIKEEVRAATKRIKSKKSKKPVDSHDV